MLASTSSTQPSVGRLLATACLGFALTATLLLLTISSGWLNVTSDYRPSNDWFSWLQPQPQHATAILPTPTASPALQYTELVDANVTQVSIAPTVTEAPTENVCQRDVKILFLNGHHGVQNEIESIMQQRVAPQIHRNVSITQTTPGTPTIGDNEAAAWWTEHGTTLSGYNLIMVGDTTSLASLLYLNNVHLHSRLTGEGDMPPILITISNRFDYGAYGWISDHLVQLSHRQNVRIVENNLFEQVFAYENKHAPIEFDAYIPAAGLVSPIHQTIFQEHLDWLKSSGTSYPSGDAFLFIVMNFHEPACIWDPLQLLPNSTDALVQLPYRSYGGPLAMKDRILVSVPYQSNTMALFENLGVGVVYALPSLNLYMKWAATKAQQADLGAFTGCKAGFDLQGHQHPLTREQLQEYMDWYRSDMQHLFIYFDSIEDLLPSSKWRQQLPRIAPLKRQAIAHYMQLHREMVTFKYVAMMSELGVLQPTCT